MNSDTEEPLMTYQERQEHLQRMWDALCRCYLEEVEREKPRSWVLQQASLFLKQNGYKRDLGTALAIKEAISELQGLDAPLIDN